MDKENRKVFVTNKGGHDFSDAERFGELVFLTEGRVNRYSINTLYRELVDATNNAKTDDYLLVSSLNILNALASSILSYKFGVVNYLLFNDGEYLVRTIRYDYLLEKTGD